VTLTLITAATVLPVSIEEARAWCGVEDASQDTVLTIALGAACKAVEKFTGLALGEQVWQATLGEFDDVITLDRGPVLSLASGGFTYRDADGATQEVDDALYALDLFSMPGAIVRLSDASWPDTDTAPNPVQVQFNTGYTAELLPDDMKAAVLITTAAMFEDRTAGSLPKGAANLLMPFRRILI